MNDEIREILDSIKKQSEEENWIQLSPEFIQPLLDYITNLQEENKRLQQNNYDMQGEMAMCWQKIDKAIEYINTWVCDEYSIAIQDPNDEWCCSTEPNAVDNLLNILQNGSDEE